jgi:hypothetical protein
MRKDKPQKLNASEVLRLKQLYLLTILHDYFKKNKKGWHFVNHNEIMNITSFGFSKFLSKVANSKEKEGITLPKLQKINFDDNIDYSFISEMWPFGVPEFKIGLTLNSKFFLPTLSFTFSMEGYNHYIDYIEIDITIIEMMNYDEDKIGEYFDNLVHERMVNEIRNIISSFV